VLAQLATPNDGAHRTTTGGPRNGWPNAQYSRRNCRSSGAAALWTCSLFDDTLHNYYWRSTISLGNIDLSTTPASWLAFAAGSWCCPHRAVGPEVLARGIVFIDLAINRWLAGVIAAHILGWSHTAGSAGRRRGAAC
jgi:hypothetical protein